MGVKKILILTFFLVSVIFGAGMYFCVKDDIKTTITAFDKAKQASQERMNQDYQAYTKPEDKK